MSEKEKRADGNARTTHKRREEPACCRVDAIVTIDSRGQIVLPKDVRKKSGVTAGNKFAVISCESGGRICCIALIRADDFAERVKGMLGPMMKGIWQ